MFIPEHNIQSDALVMLYKQLLPLCCERKVLASLPAPVTAAERYNLRDEDTQYKDAERSSLDSEVKNISQN